jgi:hypothetical protein
MENFDPCTDYYVDAYLNDPAVQKALHANVTRLDHPWSACRYTHRTLSLNKNVSSNFPNPNYKCIRQQKLLVLVPINN